MPHNVVIREARDRDIGWITIQLRSNDRLEVEALYGTDVRRTLRSFYHRSSLCRIAYVDGRPAAIWGVVAGICDPEPWAWMVTTPIVEKIPLRFFKEAKAQLREMMEGRLALRAYVATTYIQAIRFLEMLGWRHSEELGESAPFIRMRFDERKD